MHARAMLALPNLAVLDKTVGGGSRGAVHRPVRHARVGLEPAPRVITLAAGGASQWAGASACSAIVTFWTGARGSASFHLVLERRHVAGHLLAGLTADHEGHQDLADEFAGVRRQRHRERVAAARNRRAETIWPREKRGRPTVPSAVNGSSTVTVSKPREGRSM